MVRSDIYLKLFYNMGPMVQTVLFDICPNIEELFYILHTKVYLIYNYRFPFPVDVAFECKGGPENFFVLQDERVYNLLIKISDKGHL